MDVQEDATNGNAYCGVLYAKADLNTPLGALSSSVRADLTYQPYGTANKYTVYGSWVTVSSGNYGYSASPQEDAQCDEAYGDYQFPDTSATWSTGWFCF